MKRHGLCYPSLLSFLPMGERLAGRADYFKRPCDPGGIARVQQCRAAGVFKAECVVGLLGGKGANLMPYRRIDPGHRRDAFKKSAKVKPGSSHEYRNAPASMELRDFAPRRLRPIRGRASSRAIPSAKQPMVHPLHLIGGRACAQDTEIAVNLGAVGVDDRCCLTGILQGQGKPDRQIGLAACGRPCNERQRRCSATYVRRISLAHRPADSRPAGPFPKN